MVRSSARLQTVTEKVVTAVATSSRTTKKRSHEISSTKTSATVTSDSFRTTPKKVKSSSVATADNKSAWGALFAPLKKKEIERVRPLSAAPISTELQQRIDAFPRFQDVSRRSDDTVAFKIVAWNVNGLRAVLKRDDSVHLRAYAAQEAPDIICLSETKICSDELRKLEDFLPQYEHQFWSCAVKKGYASTAVLCKTKPLSVRDEIVVGSHESKGISNESENSEKDQEGRFLALEFDKFWLVHTYVPNAGSKFERMSYRTSQWCNGVARYI